VNIICLCLADVYRLDPVTDGSCISGALNQMVNTACHSSFSVTSHDPERTLAGGMLRM
jgi:hypothetical protein